MKEEKLRHLYSILDEDLSGPVEITVHDKNHKLAGMESISTNVLLNKICRARMENGDNVCHRCYASRLTNIYDSLSLKLARNTNKLSRTLKESEIPRFNTKYARIEAFGDVQNTLQAINYIRIIYSNPDTQFGIWTKNVDIWEKAFGCMGKPSNCTFVVSSQKINETDTRYENDWLVDHVFTVFTKDHPSNCAGIRCMDCLKCYKKDTEFYIDEHLR